MQKRPARCSSSGARVRGIFHFGTKVVCPGCGRTVGTRHFSALTHSAQLAAHNKSAQRKAI